MTGYFSFSFEYKITQIRIVFLQINLTECIDQLQKLYVIRNDLFVEREESPWDNG